MTRMSAIMSTERPGIASTIPAMVNTWARGADMAQRTGFWSRVRKTSGCWEWTGGHSGDGYGAITVYGRVTKAHRVAYEMAVGPIPDGLMVCHHCDNKGCVRPDHLYVGTAKQNSHDAVVRGLQRPPWTGKKRPEISGDRHWTRRMPERRVRGEGQHLAKLTEADVLAIRAIGSQMRQVDLAERFGVDQTAISNVLRRQTWKHV